MIYLDSSATSYLKPKCVQEAVYQSFSHIGNAGRGAHAPTLNASRLLYETRDRLARLFHITNPERIAFTMNATESLNIAIHGLIEPEDHVITTVCEHNSVLRPLYRKEADGARLSILPADDKGNISYEALENEINENTKAIVITHASNLTGNVHDLMRIAKIIRNYKESNSFNESQKKEGIPYLIVDASQTAGVLPIDVEAMGIDVLCFTGHKGLLGPQGTGGIYVRPGIEIPSFKVGGSGIHSFEHIHPEIMPASLEAGTSNGHGIAGLCAALSFLEETGVEQIHKKEMNLQRHFLKGLETTPYIKIYGDMTLKDRAPIISINIGDLDSAFVSDILWDEYGICTRAGAHCAPLMHETFGTERQGIVRFSFSYFNTIKEIDKTIEAIRDIAEDYIFR